MLLPFCEISSPNRTFPVGVQAPFVTRHLLAPSWSRDVSVLTLIGCQGNAILTRSQYRESGLSESSRKHP